MKEIVNVDKTDLFYKKKAHKFYLYNKIIFNSALAGVAQQIQCQPAN